MAQFPKHQAVAEAGKVTAGLGAALPVWLTATSSGGVGAGACACVEKRGARSTSGRSEEKEREIAGPERIEKRKWAPTISAEVGLKPVWFQRPALPHHRAGTAALPRLHRFNYTLCDSLYTRYRHISSYTT